MKHVTIIEDNRITGVTYGTVEINQPASKTQKPYSQSKYQQAHNMIYRCVKAKRTKNK